MALKFNENDGIEFIEIENGRREVKKYNDFSLNAKLKEIKPEITKIFFYVGVFISFLFAMVFLYLVFKGKPIPDYMVGFIGAIIGYFLAKRPYEI